MLNKKCRQQITILSLKLLRMKKFFKVIMDLCYMYFLQDTIFIWKLPLQDILVT